MKTWTFAGHLSSGEAVYWQKGGGLAVEKEHFWLMEPTTEERIEIYKKISFLRPINKEGI